MTSEEVARLTESAQEMYLDLLKRAITRSLVAGAPERHTLSPSRPFWQFILRGLYPLLASRGLELVHVRPSDPDNYLESGHEAANRIEDAESMVGLRQFDNLQYCVERVLNENIPGDLLEAGVWRGGSCIFMAGVLKAFGDTRRQVWVADSFAGLPRPDTRTESYAWQMGDMAVSLEEVQRNFSRYHLLDENVRFLSGFFSDTLPGPVKQLAILRIDADLYQSTKDVLAALYPRLSTGGYAILDDYQNLPDCRRAIDEYRAEHKISEAILPIDRRAVYWRKLS